jgi:hypothetical protein
LRLMGSAVAGAASTNTRTDEKTKPHLPIVTSILVCRDRIRSRLYIFRQFSGKVQHPPRSSNCCSARHSFARRTPARIQSRIRPVCVPPTSRIQ